MDTNTSSLDTLLENTGDMALKRRARNLINGLELKKGNIILDVGCGDGYYLYLLSNLGIPLKLYGVDVDKVGLEKARQNLKYNIPLYRADLMKRLPFKSNTFDKVIMSEVAEHLPNDIKCLREVRRVLKSKGVLVLTVPNHNYPLFWDPINWVLEQFFGIHIKSGFFAGIWNQHIRLYKPKEIVRVAEKAGFKILDLKSLTYWCLPFNHYIVNFVARVLAHGGLSTESKKALSKYTKVPKRSVFLNMAFVFVNVLDGLNDFWQPRSRGVSVYMKLRK